jgi:hypothetical protein
MWHTPTGSCTPWRIGWLGNPHEESAVMVRRRVNGVLGAMLRYRRKAAGTLAGAFAHFLKVTRSYRPGLFHTYAVPDRTPPPRTAEFQLRRGKVAAWRLTTTRSMRRFSLYCG